MANNNIGLKFDPQSALGIWGKNQSVPTVVDDYYNQSSPNQAEESTYGENIGEWNPLQFKKAKGLIDWAINTPQKEKDKLFDPFYELNKWSTGIKGLTDEEYDKWERENYDKIIGKSNQWVNRLWKNQEYAKVFGLDNFYSHTAEERDKIYEDYLLGGSIEKLYGDNSNINQLLSLTPEGKKELLDSKYKSEWQLQKERGDKDGQSNDGLFGFLGDVISGDWKSAGNTYDKWAKYSLGERLDAIAQDAGSYAYSGGILGGVVGTSVPGYGTALGAFIGIGAGLLSGTLEGIFHPEDADVANAKREKTKNDDIFNKIYIADNERKKEESKDDIDAYWNNLLLRYENENLPEDQRLTKEKVDEMFDNIALTSKHTIEATPFEKEKEVDYQGSNYYSAFKDSDIFDNFNVFDKMKYIAQSEVLARKYGQGTALDALDQDMQKYVSERQTATDWFANTAKNVWVGGWANIMMKVMAMNALATELTYGEDGLAEYLQGRDASGSGEKNSRWNDPNYWNKVDQYNTFGLDQWWNPFSYNPENMEEIEKNGGISTNTNVTMPGTENDFWTWNTMNEAARMTKFAWSDLITNVGLAKLVRGAALKAGGIELERGVMATESPMRAKAINTLGNFGVLNASSLGIDAAYGMNTFEEVLNENNAKLDKVIEKDVETEVARRLQTPEVQAKFREYVDAENERRRRSAGERGSYVGVNEKDTWDQYVNYITNQVRKEQEEAHAEDRKQAEISAANAYMVDASVEHLRMATTNGAFRSYLFDKGTLNALRLNNPYVNTTVKDGAYAVGKNARLKKYAKTLGTQIWGGFHSNYYDDVTVGLAKGFGLQEYNNYLLDKYNPAAYGAVLDDYVNPIVAALTGATEASKEKRSLMDGGIGALGVVMTVAPGKGIFNHKALMEQAAKEAEQDSKDGIVTGNKKGISLAEQISHIVTIPMIEAWGEANSAKRSTIREIKRVNDILKDNAYALDNITETALAMNREAFAKNSGVTMQVEDAKDRTAFNIASNLLTLKNSPVVANAYVEPDKSKWSKKKKAASAITDIFNTALGFQAFDNAETSYAKAMQALEDAASIEDLPIYLNEEKSSKIDKEDAEEVQKVKRQSELIQTFLGIEENQSAIQNMTEEEKIDFAKERLGKNAKNILNMMDRIEKLQNKFEKSAQAHVLLPEAKQQIMYQFAMDDRWKERSGELETLITGEENPTKITDSELSNVAKYGSKEGVERAQKEQEKRVTQAKKDYEKALEISKKEDLDLHVIDNMVIKAKRYQDLNQAKKKLQKEEALAKQLEKDKASLENSESLPVLTAEQILHLKADERYRMLDDYYLDDYSEEQQKEIEKAKNMLISDGTPLSAAMENVRDAAVLEHKIEENMEAAKNIMSHPIDAANLVYALKENRKRKIYNYFMDKVVAEAFKGLFTKEETTKTEANVSEAIKGLSTAVLQGMQEVAKGELRKISEFDELTLDNIDKGIEKVLKERQEKKKGIVELDNYINQTDKVSHTEEVQKQDQPLTIDASTGEVISQPSELVTTDKELTGNDKNIVKMALDYAVENDIPVDNLTEAVDTESFDDYVSERNHIIPIEDQVVQGSKEETKSLIKDVIDAFNEHKKNVDAAKTPKQTSDKSESVTTKPVVPQAQSEKREEEAHPNEPKVDFNDPFNKNKQRPEEAPKEEDKTKKKASVDTEAIDNITPEDYFALRPSLTDAGKEFYSENMDRAKADLKEKVEATAKHLNGETNAHDYLAELDFATGERSWLDSADTTEEDIRKTAEEEIERYKPYVKIPEVLEEEIKNDRNAEILEAATLYNQGLIGDISALLNKVDGMQMDERTRNALKDIIKALASKGYSNIKSLQREILSEAMMSNQANTPQLTTMASVLASAEIKGKKSDATTSKKAEEEKQEEEKQAAVITSVPMQLVTRDLDSLMKYPAWKRYIESHNIIPFLQRLSDAWNKSRQKYLETKKTQPLHQSQVMFIYDPALANAVEQAMKPKEGEAEADKGYYNPEIDAPIIMALEITDKNKELIDGELNKDNPNLIYIADVQNGRSHFFMPIGGMPSSQVAEYQSDAIKGTAMRMGAIRNRIPFTDKSGKPTDKPALIRVAPGSTPIHANIDHVDSYTEEDRIPHGNAEVPARNAQELMEENVMSPTENLVGNVTQEEKQKYNEAKSKGPEAVRGTDLYTKIKEVFVKRLTKGEKESANPDDNDRKELRFTIQKGTHDSFPRSIWTKKISETFHRNNPARKIIDILREVDNSESAAKELIDSNSRFTRLFKSLKNLKMTQGLFNSEGVVTDKNSYTSALNNYRNAFEGAFKNNFKADVAFKVEVTGEKASDKVVSIKAYYGDVNSEDNLIATLETKYQGSISEGEFATFMKQLILNEEGEARINPMHEKYELVKWQVNYEDAETANAKEGKTKKEKDIAADNLKDLFDDGVFDIKTTKLAYPARSVAVGNSGGNLSKVYASETKSADEVVAPVTETKAAHEFESNEGKIDANSGMKTDTRRQEILNRPEVKTVMKAVQELINRSKDRKVEGKNYNILGNLWARVTSIKSAMPGAKGRFNENSGYTLPSTALGNSFDAFGRDVYNRIFEGMKTSEKMSEFDGYDNSTKENYFKVYEILKAIEARLLANNGEVVVPTGDRENPGKITVKGLLNVLVKKGGTTENRKVRVAGTIDMLTIDENGDLAIYDFKTHRGEDFDKNTAIADGYDRQQSMYAKFLEDEINEILSEMGVTKRVKVKSINIIPARVHYPTPYGEKVDGSGMIENPEKNYRRIRPGSDQLESKDLMADDNAYEAFTKANFEVEEEFSLDRLSDEDLTASYEKMTEEEKSAIVEAIQDQSETPGEEITTTEEIISAAPEVKENEEEEIEQTHESSFGRRKFGFGKRKAGGTPQVDTSAEGTLQDVDYDNSLQSKMEDQKNNCGKKL